MVVSLRPGICRFTNLKRFILDISYNAFLEGDWSLHPEFFRAVMRATVLEGYLYVVTIGPGVEERIVSTAPWSSPESCPFARSISFQFFSSCLGFMRILTVKSNALSAIMSSFPSFHLKRRIDGIIRSVSGIIINYWLLIVLNSTLT